MFCSFRGGPVAIRVGAWKTRAERVVRTLLSRFLKNMWMRLPDLLTDFWKIYCYKYFAVLQYNMASCCLLVQLLFSTSQNKPNTIITSHLSSWYYKCNISPNNCSIQGWRCVWQHEYQPLSTHSCVSLGAGTGSVPADNLLQHVGSQHVDFEYAAIMNMARLLYLPLL